MDGTCLNGMALLDTTPVSISLAIGVGSTSHHSLASYPESPRFLPKGASSAATRPTGLCVSWEGLIRDFHDQQARQTMVGDTGHDLPLIYSSRVVRLPCRPAQDEPDRAAGRAKLGTRVGAEGERHFGVPHQPFRYPRFRPELCVILFICFTRPVFHFIFV